MKFGGSSLATPTRINNAARIVQSFSEKNRIIVVVSAMGDVTDLLIETGEAASGGESQKARSLLSRLQRFHASAASSAADKDSRRDLMDIIRELNSDLGKTVEGILHLREMTPRTRDYLLSFGERFAAPILAYTLKRLGLKSRPLTGGEAGITTDDNFGEARPLIEISYHQLVRRLSPALRRGEVPVVTGFVATSVDGNTTTLGRGGSDYTASLIGAGLEADEIWIWTDVDGLMTADPRIVNNARVLPTVSFGEALELSYFGAKMMHPRALQPAAQSKIPVRIMNSSKPNKPGTLVSARGTDDHGSVVKAISMIRDVGIVTVGGAGMVGAPGVAAKVFQALGSANVNVMMISQGSSEATISCVVARRDVERALRTLQLALLGQGFVDRILDERDDCVVAVVGSGMKGTPGVAARVFGAVSSKKVNVRMVAQGSSEYNISFVTKEKDGAQVVRAIHDEFGLGRTDCNL
jgi:aspartate kinase